MLSRTLVFLVIMGASFGLAYADEPNCLRVPLEDSSVKIDPVAAVAFSRVHLDLRGFYTVMRVVSKYETDGCWGGATGNFDGQWVSVGVMQWNFGQGSLQPLLARFKDKFENERSFEKERDKLMPIYGKDLFDAPCRAIRIGLRCKAFLQSQYVGSHKQLSKAFADELNSLFESPVMCQIQVDYFGRALTSVLDDLSRVFDLRYPTAWQIAWAMDLKTQQNRFPDDLAIKRIRKKFAEATAQQRQDFLLGIVEWYDGLCRSGDADGCQLDFQYNVDTWDQLTRSADLGTDRQELIQLTYVVSKTAQGQGGLYQADAFQRRATIAFGRGSVHGTIIDFTR